jgi:hypothetical protein
LLKHFPRLAQVPIDTNSFQFEPLRSVGTEPASPLGRVVTAVRKNMRRWYWRSWRKEEPRRYQRSYDFDGPGWRAVRAAAEPHRDRVGPWLNRDVLDALLPEPHVTLGLRDPFAGGSGRRALLGLMLWSSPREETSSANARG